MTEDPELVSLVDDAVLAEAVASRLRRRTLAAADADDATLLGTLLRLAQLGVSVTVDTRDGATLRGLLVEVAPQHVVLDVVAGSRTVVALDAVTAVRTGSRAPAPTDVDVLVGTGSLGDALRGLAERRDQVRVTTLDGAATRGRVTQVGRDVLRVTSLDGAVLVPLAVLAHVTPTS